MDIESVMPEPLNIFSGFSSPLLHYHLLPVLLCKVHSFLMLSWLCDTLWLVCSAASCILLNFQLALSWLDNVCFLTQSHILTMFSLYVSCTKEGGGGKGVEQSSTASMLPAFSHESCKGLHMFRSVRGSLPKAVLEFQFKNFWLQIIPSVLQSQI